MFEIKVENSFDFLSSEYADLFLHSDATAFQHPQWLDRLYANLVLCHRAEPLVVTVRSASSGNLVMVLPLVRLRRGGMKVIEFADLQVSDYVSPVCDRSSFLRILNDGPACAAIRNALLPYDILRIQKMTQGSMPLERLLGVKSRASMNMNAYSVPLQSSFEQWRLDSMDRSYRKELEKKERQLLRKGRTRFECSSDPEFIRKTFHGMREYRRLRFNGEDLLQRELYLKFYLEVATEGANTGYARTYALLMDDRPIAGVLGLSHKGECLVILGGFDHAGFKNLSIGSLVFQAIAKDCIAKGDVRLDFTIGDEPYKRLFGAQPTSMWGAAAAATPLGKATSFVLNQLPWAKSVAKRFARPTPVPTSAG